MDLGQKLQVVVPGVVSFDQEIELLINNPAHRQIMLQLNLFRTQGGSGHGCIPFSYALSWAINISSRNRYSSSSIRLASCLNRMLLQRTVFPCRICQTCRQFGSLRIQYSFMFPFFGAFRSPEPCGSSFHLPVCPQRAGRASEIIFFLYEGKRGRSHLFQPVLESPFVFP